MFGLQHGGFFLLAWELMSLGGAVMILNERLNDQPGGSVLFMLAMLEVGSVALLVAIIIMALPAHGLAFADFARAGALVTVPAMVGVLFVIGFGAKLGLLPFYEWFPGAYGSGSGASGTIMSGVVLNAAYFGISRSLMDWLPSLHMDSAGFGIFIIAVGVLSAILSVLYAFQQEDWRCLLSFSSAENASVAVALLGAALLFRQGGLPDLAGLAWTVALLHLAGHALAKGGLFLTADGVFAATGGYLIRHSLLIKRAAWLFGLGALFCAMSSCRDAAASGVRERVVRFPDGVPGLPSAGPGRPPGAGAGWRRPGTDRRRRLRHLHQSVWHRPVGPRQSQRRVG